MVVAGTLNDICARRSQVSVAVAGQLITVAAVVMCFGAPLLAGWVGAARPPPAARRALALVRDRPRAVRADAELRGAAAGARADRPRRRRVHAAGGRGDRRDGAAGRARPRRSPSSSSAGRSPRCVGMPISALARRHLRLAQRFRARSPRSALVARGLGAARRCRPAFARPTLTLAAWRAAFAQSGADGDRARSPRCRRRPVHAVLVLRAVLQDRARRRARTR